MTMLTVNVQSAPPTVTLLCHGRIVLGVEAETLRCIATSRPERRVVIDLRDVYGMDASGLGLLVELYCHARQRSGCLSIANPSPRVRHLMAMTNLESVLAFQVLEEEDFDPCERRAMTA
jgi:anti-anti-sigma factor